MSKTTPLSYQWAQWLRSVCLESHLELETGVLTTYTVQLPDTPPTSSGSYQHSTQAIFNVEPTT